MKINCFGVMILLSLLASGPIAEGNEFWIDLADSQRFQYGSITNSAVQGDLDGDGVVDVVVGTSESAFTYPGKCFILWGGTDYQELCEIVGDIRVVAIEDLDSDGRKDIACMHQVFYNEGNRIFTRVDDIGFSPITKFADVNEDGVLDYITGSYWKNGSDGTVQGFGVSANYFSLIDMNNDGKLDVIGYRYDIPKLYWYENTGNDPLFNEEDNIVAANITPLDVIDYDFDGDLDLFVINERMPGFLVNNNGILPIIFKPLFTSIPDGYIPDINNKIIDMDLDGDWDLFGYNYDEKRFFVVEQIGYRSLQLAGC